MLVYFGTRGRRSKLLPPRVSKGRSKLFWQIERGTKGHTASVAVLVDSAPWVVVKTIFILEDPSFENPY